MDRRHGEGQVCNTAGNTVSCQTHCHRHLGKFRRFRISRDPVHHTPILGQWLCWVLEVPVVCGHQGYIQTGILVAVVFFTKRARPD